MQKSFDIFFIFSIFFTNSCFNQVLYRNTVFAKIKTFVSNLKFFSCKNYFFILYLKLIEGIGIMIEL